jgi:hypothetical protein
MDLSEAFERICTEISRIRTGTDACDDAVRTYLQECGEAELTLIFEDFVANFWEEIDDIAAADAEAQSFDFAALRSVSEGTLSRAVVFCLELACAERTGEPDPEVFEAAKQVASFWLRHGVEMEEQVFIFGPVPPAVETTPSCH